MREADQNRIAAVKKARGIDVDVEAFSEWRMDADPDNLALLEFYGRYLVNQYAGMGSALNLGAVREAFLLDGIASEDWPDMTERLLSLHAEVVKLLPKE